MSNTSPLTRRKFLTGLAMTAAAAIPLAKIYGAVSLNSSTTARPMVVKGYMNRRKYTKRDRHEAKARRDAFVNGHANRFARAS
jgi:hypothetical protein